MASGHFAFATSPLSVTSPPLTSTVTPVTPAFESAASVLFLMAVSSEAVTGVGVATGVAAVVVLVLCAAFVLLALSSFPQPAAPSARRSTRALADAPPADRIFMPDLLLFLSRLPPYKCVK